MDIVLGIGSSLLILFLGIFGIRSIIQAIKLLVKVRKHEIDERYEFMVFKALGYTMIIIFLLHIIQLFIGNLPSNKWQESGRYFIPVISAGMPYGSLLDNMHMHIEAIIFDGLVFGILFRMMKKQYGE
ncbi:hypothetical protein ACYSNW_00910 [Enterococcus sp. LJL99]